MPLTPQLLLCGKDTDKCTFRQIAFDQVDDSVFHEACNFFERPRVGERERCLRASGRGAWSGCSGFRGRIAVRWPSCWNWCGSPPHAAVHSLIREPVGFLVFAAEDVLHLEAAELGGAAFGFLVQRLEVRAFDAVLALDLLDHELRVGNDPELAGVVRERPLERGEQARIFGYVVSLDADEVAELGQGGAVFRLNKNAVPGGAGIAAGAAVAKGRDAA